MTTTILGTKTRRMRRIEQDWWKTKAITIKEKYEEDGIFDNEP